MATATFRCRLPMHVAAPALTAALVASTLGGCGKNSAPDGATPTASAAAASTGLSGSPLPVRAGREGPLFDRLDPAATGVEVISRVNKSHPLKRLYHSGSAIGGVAVGDLDGDGRPDLFFAGTDGPNRLFLQTGTLTFEEATGTAGVAGGEAWGVGATMADIDGDGDPDLYVCNYDEPNQLFRNDGRGTDGRLHFTECAAAFGLAIRDACVTSSFCDYDHDGDLDIFVLTNRYYLEGGRPAGRLYETGPTGEPVIRRDLEKYLRLLKIDEKRVLVSDVGRPDMLFRNDGPNAGGQTTFTNVSEVSGVNAPGFGLSATWWDYDGDGWMDLYVANDFDYADRLYHNQHDGTFVHAINEVVPHTSWFSMGTAAGDVNNDGLMDFIVLDMAATSHFKEKVSMGDMSDLQRLILDYSEPRQMMRNALLINTGRGRMLEAAHLAGVAKTDWSWAPKFEDFDNDGRLDLFVSNGMIRDFNNSDIARNEGDLVGRNEWDIYENAPEKREKNLAYRNRGDLQFEPVSHEWGLDHEGMSYGTAAADLDGDGDQDLVVVNFEEPAALWRNNSTTGHRLAIELRGQGRNTQGLGASVQIETAQGRQLRTLQPYNGFLASDQPRIHFGLGDATLISSLTVTWPGGQKQEFANLVADQLLTITQPAPTPAAAPAVPVPPATLFAEREAIRGAVAAETPFDDFAVQELLPNKLSQLGPGVAWGDVNHDGRWDLYLGGAAGELGRLYIDHGGKYQIDAIEPFAADKACEDMGAVFFDVDRDGDQDLYVVSGSYEFPANDPRLADRLYLNDGNGRFTKAPPDALPTDERDAGSVVCAVDFDHDGDLDLFVGGRVVPGQYPMTPRSRLLVNDSSAAGPLLADRSDSLAPGLAATGLVTGALWSDVDGDGWPDLLVTHEWGPVSYFHNDHGRLADQTAAAGLAARLGWWNGLAAGDVDNDGDLDYAVTNFGLNLKYKASEEKPVLGFFGDFAGDGRKNFVEAKYNDEHVLLPVRGKSCSSHAMPHLKEKFSTFQQFASATLDEIYTPERLDEAFKVQLNELRSGVLLNQSVPGAPARFEFRPLPRFAQIAPSFGVVVGDLDGDGRADIVLAQNFYHPQRETGRMDGGVSLLLKGRGDGEFDPMAPAASGIVVPGQAAGVTLADWDGDCRPDLFFVQNNAPAKSFLNQAHSAAGGTSLSWVLEGPPGNPLAAGTRLRWERAGDPPQTVEIASGSGYLSQGPPLAFFGGRGSEGTLTVTWPDGRQSVLPPGKSETSTPQRVSYSQTSQPGILSKPGLK